MTDSRKIRWWPLWVIVSLDAIAVVWVWNTEMSSRQDAIFATLGIQVLALVLALLWLLALSRARWVLRLTILAALVLVLAAARALLRIEQVSGDFLPVLTWRWAQERDEQLEPPQVAPSGASQVLAEMDYPQFLGPERRAEVDVVLDPNWAHSPPELLWRIPIGAGWSGFAVQGGRAITLEQRSGEAWVTCYELGSGNVLWTHHEQRAFESTVAGDGPRSTPTISRDRVFTVGAWGHLSCLTLEDGALIWSRDVLSEHGGELNEWGAAYSPLVIGDLVVTLAGGEGAAVVAYDREGQLQWKAGDLKPAYSSPAWMTLGGRDQVVAFCSGGLIGVDPVSGSVLWQQDWPGQQPNVAQPRQVGADRLFASTGYGIGSKLYRFEADESGSLRVTTLWESNRMKAKFSNVVQRDGFIYGLDDGILVCLDLEDGMRRWKRGRYGHGQLILTRDHLLITGEKGDLALVDVDPEAYREVARIEVFDDKTWNSPALAGSHLLMRNAVEAACFRLTTR